MKRPACARCLRPATACLCAAVRPVAHAVQVLVLMHPQEAGHAKNTGRLLHLCLPGSRVIVGEAFDPAVLAQPWHAADPPRHALLLYPPTPPNAQHPMHPPPALPLEWLAEPARLRLVVLDGTWRKSRRMLWANPALQRLPRLALDDVPPSRYAIRKAHAAHQLSTLEAVECALRQLEPGNAAIAALGEAMQAFMEIQRSYFFKNHSC
jgi:DTW domain-containing protein YfiP